MVRYVATPRQLAQLGCVTFEARMRDANIFQRYFHFDRFPILTMLWIGILLLTYVLMQAGQPHTPEALLQQGAKSRAVMIELHQWWRLITANMLHASVWHLLANVFFLLNLGGPAESMYRRADYALIVVASALGTTLLSTWANHQISCGASGIVFGIWGAVAVFGVRYHAWLPPRYQRYFFGSVIPYVIFALYSGFAWPGVDHWGHLGGLLSGMAVAAWAPARILAAAQARHVRSPMLALASITVVLLLACTWSYHAAPMPMRHSMDTAEMSIPIPTRWHALFRQTHGTRQTHAYGNELGVSIAWEIQRDCVTQDVDTLVRQFVSEEMTSAWDGSAMQSIRLQEPETLFIHGHAARRIRTEVRYKGDLTWAEYVIVAAHQTRYVINLNAPMWLAASYRPMFDRMLQAIHLPMPVASQGPHVTPP